MHAIDERPTPAPARIRNAHKVRRSVDRLRRSHWPPSRSPLDDSFGVVDPRQMSEVIARSAWPSWRCMTSSDTPSRDISTAWACRSWWGANGGTRRLEPPPGGVASAHRRAPTRGRRSGRAARKTARRPAAWRAAEATARGVPRSSGPFRPRGVAAFVAAHQDRAPVELKVALGQGQRLADPVARRARAPRSGRAAGLLRGPGRRRACGSGEVRPGSGEAWVCSPVGVRSLLLRQRGTRRWCRCPPDETASIPDRVDGEAQAAVGRLSAATSSRA